MKAKKRSPETLYETKSDHRSHVDDLRRARKHRREWDDLKAAELRSIDAQESRGFFEALRDPTRDPRSLDALLRFLEEDPYHMSSGYMKELALKRISRWSLDSDDRRRIAGIVLNAVDGPTAREFRRQCKAARLADREVLVPGLIGRLRSPDEGLRQRAYLAAVGMFQDPWPCRPTYNAEGQAWIAPMLERLRALPEAMHRRLEP